MCWQKWASLTAHHFPLVFTQALIKDKDDHCFLWLTQAPGSKICVSSDFITVTIVSDKYCDPTECISGFVKSTFQPKVKKTLPINFYRLY